MNKILSIVMAMAFSLVMLPIQVSASMGVVIEINEARTEGVIEVRKSGELYRFSISKEELVISNTFEEGDYVFFVPIVSEEEEDKVNKAKEPFLVI